MVCGILAVLTAVFVLILNPVERMREQRDVQRILDLAEIKKSLSFYVSIVENPDLDIKGNCENAYQSTAGATAVDGTGWLPVNFDQIPGGSTLKKLPLDPINNEEHFYSYQCVPNSLKFNLDAKMESKKYRSEAANSSESTK